MLYDLIGIKTGSFSTIQDPDLHIPEVTLNRTSRSTFLRKTMSSPLCAEKIDAVRKCGMEISESWMTKVKLKLKLAKANI